MSDLTDSTVLPELYTSIKTVFLDRDGVINRKLGEGHYVTSWEHFELLPGAPTAIADLNRCGLRVIVVTNQRGIALGLYTDEIVETIHSKLQQELAHSGARIDRFYFCPHERNECNCRKPLPGLFEQAQIDFPDIDAATSVMIGN